MARHKVSITTHAKQRLCERTEKEKALFLSFSRSAYRKGLVWPQIEVFKPAFANSASGKKIKKYLSSKYGRRKKFYKDYIFIFGKTGRKLITMYPCKEEFICVLENIWDEIYKSNKK